MGCSFNPRTVVLQQPTTCTTIQCHWPLETTYTDQRTCLPVQVSTNKDMMVEIVPMPS